MTLSRRACSSVPSNAFSNRAFSTPELLSSKLTGLILRNFSECTVLLIRPLELSERENKVRPSSGLRGDAAYLRRGSLWCWRLATDLGDGVFFIAVAREITSFTKGLLLLLLLVAAAVVVLLALLCRCVVAFARGGVFFSGGVVHAATSFAAAGSASSVVGVLCRDCAPASMGVRGAIIFILIIFFNACD